jgi:type IX secretion system PorP/SprF family membrane protein
MKFYIIKISFVIAFLVFSLNIKAQQSPKYIQYMYNSSVFNPAYITTKENLNFFGLYSAQWVGLEGAPKTANLSFSMPVSEKGLYIGANIIHDKIGAITDNNIAINIGYKIKLNYKYNLAFALKGSVNILNVDYTKLDVYEGTDPIMADNISNKFSGNIGAGIFAFSEKAYIGLSIPHVLQNKASTKDGYKVMIEKFQVYFTGGYVFDINPNLLLKPAFLLTSVQQGDTFLDLTLNAHFFDKFSFGLSYSTSSSIALLTDFNIGERFFIGYGVSKQTNSFRKESGLSHEIFLRFDVLKGRGSSSSAPRFF